MATAKAKNAEKGAGQVEDQSMEEILQSIRKIIAEESDESLLPEGEDEEGFGELEVDSDVLELTDVLQDDGSVVNINTLDDVLNNIDEALDEDEDEPAFAMAEQAGEEDAPAPFIPPAMEPVVPERTAFEPDAAEPAPMFSEPATAQKPVEPAAQKPAPASLPEEKEGDGLVSDISIAASREALKALKTSKPMGQLHFTSGETVEGLVAHLLRPMLKEWLDANLPVIVQKEVQREIQRISTSLEQNS